MKYINLLIIITFIYCQKIPLYDYSMKGKNWLGICSSGLYQSPIDIPN